jgi:ribosomal protein S18
MTASQDSTSQNAGDQRPESALLVAARQLSEEAALHPRLAGLSGVRQRTVATAVRRAARRMTVMPTA